MTNSKSSIKSLKYLKLLNLKNKNKAIFNSLRNLLGSLVNSIFRNCCSRRITQVSNIKAFFSNKAVFFKNPRQGGSSEVFKKPKPPPLLPRDAVYIIATNFFTQTIIQVCYNGQRHTNSTMIDTRSQIVFLQV